MPKRRRGQSQLRRGGGGGGSDEATSPEPVSTVPCLNSPCKGRMRVSVHPSGERALVCDACGETHGSASGRKAVRKRVTMIKTVVIEGGMIPLMETHADEVAKAIEAFVDGVAQNPAPA